MPDLGSAYVNIVPKAPGISGEIEDILNGGGGGADKAGLGLGKRLMGGLGKAVAAGKAIGAMLQPAFEAGGALQQSFGGLDTIYGEAAAGAKEYAMQAASAGISANTYAEQAVSMGAALKAAYGGDTTAAMSAANTAIMDMADNAAKMGTPIESLQAAYQGFAKGQYQLLDNLKLGYGGTKTEMERLLQDAQAITGVEYNIDNLGDVYDAVHVIQGELGLTGVAAAESQTTLTGSFSALQASWTNVMAALTTGEGLDTAMANMTNSVGAFASNVLSMLGTLGPQLGPLISGLANTAIEHAPEFLASGIELIAQMAVGLINGLPELLAKLPEMFTQVSAAFSTIDWASLGRELVNGIIRGLWAAASGLYNAVKNMIKNALRSGQTEAQTGSPSKLFANELGRWIPAGVAMGVDQNMSSLDRAMQGMADGSLAAAQGAAAVPAAAGAGNDADRIIAALQALRLQADVTLEGDARGIFRVVRQTNMVRTRATNYNALAAGG